MSLPDEIGWIADRIVATARHRRRRSSEIWWRLTAWCALAVVGAIALTIHH